MGVDNFFCYENFLFDCDGVIFDSNNIKANCFYEATLKYGQDLAAEFTQYCKRNWGMSRFHFFHYFVEHFLHKSDVELEHELIKQYSQLVEAKLENCNLTDGAQQLFEILRSKDKNCYVVSGGLEVELKKLFNQRGLDPFFISINGSPRTKEKIIQDLDLPVAQCIFIGDSLKDQVASIGAGIDFLFVSKYSDIQSSSLKYPFFEIATFLELLPK